MFAGRGTFARPWRRRRGRRDDTGSMPLAMLVTLVGVTLSASVSGMVIGQLKTSQRAADRVAAVSAAQAGLDFALARIRSSVDVTGAGKLSALPCDWSTVSLPPLPALTGTTGATAAYSVSVGYFLNDPAGMVQDLASVDLSRLNLLAGSNVSVNGLLGQLGLGGSTPTTGLTNALRSAVGCVQGVLQQVPLYGLVRATGTVGTATRTLSATYTFHNVDETIPGGRLTIAGTGGGLCIGDAATSPQENDDVSAVPCTASDLQAEFIYPKNLSLALANTKTGTNNSGGNSYPYGLCITAVTPPVDGEKATFQKCSGTRAVSQEWDYDVNRQTYYGAAVSTDANGATTVVRSGYCLSVDATSGVVAGAKIVMRTGSNCGTANVLGKAFVPDASVGAGGAGTGSSQYVNKGEVGRCLDLTNEDPSGGWATRNNQPLALISYPCKQTFTGDVYWNHRWTGPLTPDLIQRGVTSARGLIYVTQPVTPATQWCLKSPGAAGGFLWVALCDAADTTQQWTVYGGTPSAATAYEVTDGYNCVEAAGWRGAPYFFSGTISYVITAPCSGIPEQKWNAPTDTPAGPLRSIQEK